MLTISQEAKYTLQFINQTQRNIFLTGNAGTGKTTLLREIIRTTHKNVVVVAPTGIAALNAGGVTIHSLFQLPFSAFIPDYTSPQFSEFARFETKSTLARHFKMSGLKKSVIRNMELLIIDEVSMVRADLLDAMNFMLQSVRKTNAVFGGVQILFIGDLLQLPPVIRDYEWKILRNYYNGKYFFHSHVIQQNPPLYIELSKIFRQTDANFISLLNNLRLNQISKENIELLNSHVNIEFDIQKEPGFITLTTHNAKADVMNSKALADLEGKLIRYMPEITGDFPEKIFPTDEVLELKEGAQIMFIKNDLSFEKRFFNGKMGSVKAISENEILVLFPDENTTILVEKHEWQNIRYSLNTDTKEIEEEVLGTFVHYPIKLAWAITIHKSQGLTFDKAILDVSDVFLPGQAYVALSRLRSLKGLVLLSPLKIEGMVNDVDVVDYAKNKASSELLKNSLTSETQKFLLNYLKNSFEWQDLTQEWRNHQFSYEDKSNASVHFLWAKKHKETMETILEPAKKFLRQLDQIFSNETINYQFIEERINAAYNYFFAIMDELVYEILWKLEEVKRMKKAKTFFEELIVLEEIQIKSVVRMMKAKMMIKNIVSKSDISRENLTSEDIKFYKINKLKAVQEEFKKQNRNLINEDESIERYTRLTKKKKESKKSTIQETFELWQGKHSIEEIAVFRKLTVQTIENHMAKLIENGSVSILDVLPEDRISELEKAFEGYEEEALAPLKEKYDNYFTWNELKLYKALKDRK